MKIKLAFSPCPNDTFIFDALINKKIDTEGFEFSYQLADVEQLNNFALNQKFDVCKVSLHTYMYIHENYILLSSGSALGNNVGPLIISKKSINSANLNELKIAIPGKLTTANLLLSLIYPEIKNKIEVVFSEIEDKIISEEVDAGVIIHENRFTYHDKGLLLFADLGNCWKELTKQPIPLGGIVVKRNLPDKIKLGLKKLIKKSVEFAINNPESSKDFVRCYSQEMSDDVIKKHIQLYVNNFTLELGEKGKFAIETIFQKGVEKGLITKFLQNALFL